MAKIVHIIKFDKKFIPSYIDFVNKNFNPKKHLFIITGNLKGYNFKKHKNIIYKKSLLGGMVKISTEMHRSDKIILHSLFGYLPEFLFIQPWLLAKCYWIIWGWDLYYYKDRPKCLLSNFHELFRKYLIKHIGHVSNYISGEYELLKKWYKTDAQYIKIFNYPSALDNTKPINEKEQSTIKILLGNSASRTNNHKSALNKIKLTKKSKNICIICPLSYGKKEYTDSIMKYGKKLFGNRFIPITDFMSLKKYKDLLAEIDIAVFNNNRQQGMSTIIYLIGMGKKVFMRPNLTSSKHLNNLGVKIFNINKLSLSPDFKEKQDNIRTIKKYYSKKKLTENLEILFNND